jgi:hypothetical protein
MANDTDRILAAIKESKDESLKERAAIWERLEEHSKDIGRINTAMALHGVKIGFLVAIVMAFGGIIVKVSMEKIEKFVGGL